MPWKVNSPVDLRKEMMDRLANGERMTDLCREYGISRKTGNKFKARFDQMGILGLEDQSRAPKVIPHRTPPELMALVLQARREHPTWGPRKLKDVLERTLGRPLPSHAAIGQALVRAGLTMSRKKRFLCTPTRSTLRVAAAPNDVWCIDYKGQFRLGDRSYCYPLTMTDQHARFILACEGMAAIADDAAHEVCEESFRQWGLPEVIRSDNGPPFASTGLAGLTKLAVYFIRLGIKHERIRPAHPEENGRHERMHRTLKAETTRPARANLLQQQERFDEWVHVFNNDRPHEALGMKRPAEVFAASPRALPAKLPELDYPTHDDVIRVNPSGSIHIAGRGTVYITVALANQHVGVREEDNGEWCVTFATIDLGRVDRQGKLRPMSA